MQAVANLRFLQVTQISVQTRQPDRRVGVAVGGVVQRQFTIDTGFTDQFENVPLQLAGPARIEQLRLIELVGEQLQIAQRAVGFGTGQRRHQVIDDHRLRAAFGLSALARVIDDERIDIGHGAQHGIRPAGLRQPDAFAWQPFQIAVLADMHYRMRAIGLAQPEVERQIAVRRHQVRVVIDRTGVHLIATRRLNADEGQTKAQAGDHHSAAAEHGIGIRRAPTGSHRVAIFGRQLVERRQVFIQRHALLARSQVNAVQVVGHAAQQLLDQFGAGVR
ncbi:primosome assembly protein PriA [Pseudomonas syringae pv. spinaceae]|uniref:Primosome assembly protein PriA n=1 Tax=Pseudomonas syringae pv. spinaceae TaxID=264459 RepID=A0A0N8T3M2_PSESX|nr:primosome assembly protein PriA [Pseudomonas syringae pv. spinaceae]